MLLDRVEMGDQAVARSSNGARNRGGRRRSSAVRRERPDPSSPCRARPAARSRDRRRARCRPSASRAAGGGGRSTMATILGFASTIGRSRRTQPPRDSRSSSRGRWRSAGGGGRAGSAAPAAPPAAPRARRRGPRQAAAVPPDLERVEDEDPDREVLDRILDIAVRRRRVGEDLAENGAIVVIAHGRADRERQVRGRSRKRS